MNGNNAIYYDSFGVEHIPKKNKNFIGKKNIEKNVYRIQAYDSIKYGYYCIGFIDSMVKGKILLNYTNFFFPNKYENNDKIVLKYLHF